jgi:hypothetical protein
LLLLCITVEPDFHAIMPAAPNIISNVFTFFSREIESFVTNATGGIENEEEEEEEEEQEEHEVSGLFIFNLTLYFIFFCR